MTATEDKCPCCGEGRLGEWDELSAEDQEVVRRLPGAAAYPFEQRAAAHRWCNRCWYEETTHTPRNA